MDCGRDADALVGAGEELVGSAGWDWVASVVDWVVLEVEWAGALVLGVY